MARVRPAPATLRRPRDNAAGRLDRAARALADDGWPTELQGTAIHGRHAPAVVGYGLVSILACLLAVAGRPLLATSLASGVLAGGLTDLMGGCSWVRRLVPRDGHRNVLLWPHGAPPVLDPGPWVTSRPPPDPPGTHHLLVLLPAHPRRRAPRVWPALGALFGAIAFAAILASLALPADAAALTGATAAVVLFVAVLIATALKRRSGAPRAAQGVALARALAEAVPPTPHTRVGIGIIGGLEPWFDGIETLLRGHADRLPPQTTTVVVWHPGVRPLAAVRADGLFQQQASDALVEHVLRAGIVEAPISRIRPWRTGALRARRIGWSAVGLIGGQASPATFTKLTALVGAIAREARP